MRATGYFLLLTIVLVANSCLANAWFFGLFSVPIAGKKAAALPVSPHKAIDRIKTPSKKYADSQKVAASEKEVSEKYDYSSNSKYRKRSADRPKKDMRTNTENQKRHKTYEREQKSTKGKKRLQKKNKSKEKNGNKGARKWKKSKKGRITTKKNKSHKSREAKRNEKAKMNKNKYQRKVKVNGKRLPATCYCRMEASRNGKCYYYTEKNSDYCKYRYCARRWVCVGHKKTGKICILRKVRSRIVPYYDNKCVTKRVKSYMYVPYAY